MAKKKISTEAEAVAFLRDDNGSLEDVPAKLRTEAVCLAAVQQNGGALEYVPEALRTAALCLVACYRNNAAIKYVPKQLREIAKLCNGLKNVEKDPNILVSSAMPEKNKIPEFYLASIYLCPESLRYIPDRSITPEMCTAAVQADGQALEYVPEALKAQVKKAAGLGGDDDDDPDDGGDDGWEDWDDSDGGDDDGDGGNDPDDGGDDDDDDGGRDDEGEEDPGYPSDTELAILLREEGRYDESIAVLDKVFRLEADDSERAAVLSIRARTYKEMGDYRKALADIDEALRLKPDSISREERKQIEGAALAALMMDGTAAEESGSFDAAAGFYRRAIAVADDCGAAWYGLAKSLLGKKDYDAAAEAADKAKELDPGNKEYQMLRIRINQASWDDTPEEAGAEVNPAIAAEALARLNAAFDAPASAVSGGASMAGGVCIADETCASCGAALKPGAKFCPECGAKYEPRPKAKFCAECGAKLDKPVKFCPECGAKA